VSNMVQDQWYERGRRRTDKRIGERERNSRLALSLIGWHVQLREGVV